MFQWDPHGTAVAVIGAFGDDFCRRLVYLKRPAAAASHMSQRSDTIATQRTTGICCYDDVTLC